MSEDEKAQLIAQRRYSNEYHTYYLIKTTCRSCGTVEGYVPLPCYDNSRMHKKLLARASLESAIRFHDLRHTFSTVMIQNGVDAKTLSGMLGHYSVAFTLDTYTHMTSQMQEAAAEKMSNFMEGITL